MEKKPTSIPVVAALICDENGRLLLQQCPAHKRHAGKWEFPGGKVENGETPQFALSRELEEELGLGLDTAPMKLAGSAEEPACEGRPGIVLFLYRCPVWRGVPVGLEGQTWGWFSKAEASALELPEMDRALLATI